MGWTPSAPSSASCTSVAAAPRRGTCAQPKGPRSSRPPFASRDEDGLAVHALVEHLVEHRPRALTEHGRDLEPHLGGELADLLDRVMTMALAADRPAPEAVALVGEDVDDDLRLSPGPVDLGQLAAPAHEKVLVLDDEVRDVAVGGERVDVEDQQPAG